ncbi:hypothetical protein [Halovivax gelatinilyticus]|uniref:hypothetical protein n=1 Tax=Halovivax gelatinilyticus TaxID=2961597 RepID=UPI0020CA3DAC|nr:hypothetical protein [Halovivax gelatinilyticus]
MRRRTLLAGIGSTAAITTVAGCLGDDDDGDDPGEDGSTGSGSASPSIETVAQSELERSKDDERNIESIATISGDVESVEIAGSLEAPTPCYEAVITDVTVEDETLTVYVELEETDDEMCTQQIAEIEYEATIVVESGEPTHVVVIHTDRVGEVTAADEPLDE